MEKQEEDIYATSQKGVGEINPPRKQGEDASGNPVKAEHTKEEHSAKGHTKEAAEKAQAEPSKPDIHAKKK